MIIVSNLAKKATSKDKMNTIILTCSIVKNALTTRGEWQMVMATIIPMTTTFVMMMKHLVISGI